VLIVNQEGPKFVKGDLVVLQDPDFITALGGLAVIVRDPVLVFVHDWECIQEFPKEFWCYDIYVGSKLFTQIPEQMLRSLKNENKVENTQRK